MEDERFKSLPPSGRALVKTLLDIVEQILSGRCDEEEIEDVSRRVNPDMKGYKCEDDYVTIDEEEIEDVSRRVNPDMKGYKCEDDYVTIDEGMRIMHYNRNRNGFCNLMKKYGIPNETFNNIKIGYNRNRLIVLKHKLDEDCARRKHRGEIQRMRDNEYTNKSNNT